MSSKYSPPNSNSALVSEYTKYLTIHFSYMHIQTKGALLTISLYQLSIQMAIRLEIVVEDSLTEHVVPENKHNWLNFPWSLLTCPDIVYHILTDLKNVLGGFIIGTLREDRLVYPNFPDRQR